MTSVRFEWVRIAVVASAALCLIAASPQQAASQQSAQRQAAITASDLATLRDLDGLAVSPDDQWAAFQVRQADPRANAYTQAWYVVPVAGGAARRLADAGEPVPSAYLGRVNGFILSAPPVWSPDSQWIAYLRKDHGRTQIWRARIDGRRSEQLTRGESDARALAYSADGARILYEVELSAAQIAAGLAREGLSGFRYDQRFFPSYSPLPALPADINFGNLDQLTTEAQEAQRRVFVYEIARRRERPASESEAAEFAALTAAPAPANREHFRDNAARSPTGALAWTEARDPERQGGMAPLTIVAQPAGAAEPIVCAAPACTSQVLGQLWWRNENEVLFVGREGPSFTDRLLYSWRVGDAAPRLVLRTQDLFASEYEWKCAVAQDRLVCFYEAANQPRRLVAIDLDSGAVNILFDPNPDFARFDLGAPPQRLEFHSPAGVDNYGYLVLPPHHTPGQRLPLVIVTYRCAGFLRGGVGDEYPVYPFAAQGFAVLCFNAPDTDYERLQRLDWVADQNLARGSGDPEKHRVQEGLDAAIAQLDRMGVIDPDRVGLTGLSFGAETVTYALFHMPRLAAAIASGTEFGPLSPILYGPAGRQAITPWGLDSPTSPRWDALSITRNAARVRAPLLLNVADHEMIDALHPYTALEEAGRAVEMYVYPDEYHIKWQPAHRLSVYNRNIDWMNFWLRNVEDPDPAKASQYEHWRALRERVAALRQH